VKREQIALEAEGQVLRLNVQQSDQVRISRATSS